MKVEESMQNAHPDTPAHSGSIASGGRGYNEDETWPSGQAPAARDADLTREPRKGLGKGFWIFLLVALIVIALIVIFGINSRSESEQALRVDTTENATQEVRVVYPSGGGANGELTLPGNTQAYVDTPIYSRTNGYLQKWYFDIGAHVRKGQLMATIETPELDQQLQVAEADLKSAQANLNLANITSARYQNLLKSNSVSKQETDEAIGSAASKQAAVEASMAAVRRLQQLQGFEKVYAPFDGVVTARNTDIGDLITGGSGSSSSGGGSVARPLFRLASINQLRVFVAVPEVYSAAIRDGGSATLTADEYPGQVFEGRIARNASAIDPATRTLNVEVDVPNGGGKLLPGAYVMVHFKMPMHGTGLILPSNTLIFRAQGMQVGVVRDGRVQLTPVKIAQDRGATVVVATGITANDAVIVDPSDSIQSGQRVRIKGAGDAK